jgi:hypothetical protein
MGDDFPKDNPFGWRYDPSKAQKVVAMHAEAGLKSGKHKDGHFSVCRKLRATQLLGEDRGLYMTPCGADGTAAGVGRSEQKAQTGWIRCRLSLAWVIGRVGGTQRCTVSPVLPPLEPKERKEPREATASVGGSLW